MSIPPRFVAALFTLMGLFCLAALAFFLRVGIAAIGGRVSYAVVTPGDGALYYFALAFWAFLGAVFLYAGIGTWRERDRPAAPTSVRRPEPRGRALPWWTAVVAVGVVLLAWIGVVAALRAGLI